MRNIYDLSADELVDMLAGWGEPSYRARQIWEWLYRHKVASFDAMTNIPRGIRERLAAETLLGNLEEVSRSVSSDGETLKKLLKLNDGVLIESVLMRYERRRTACLSTQAGCAVGCAFCATGQMGFVRNLTSGEIVEQAIHFARELESEGGRLSNVVLMGMGEPMLNYDAVLTAIRRLNDPHGIGIGQRHITLSTAGVVPGIRRFTAEGLQVRLAVSLHAATDELRDRLVPLNRKWPLADLIAACRYYVERVGRRVTFEWALINGVNDTSEQADALGALLGGLTCHVNLIPLNPTDGFEGRPSDPARVRAFAARLEQLGIPVTVRLRRGIDISAGCGQLRAAHGKSNSKHV